MENKLFDLEVALERIGGDREFLFELLHELMGQMEENTESLEAAVKNGDFYNLKAIAHGLKGVASNLGADRVADYFNALEKKGTNQELEGAEELINQIRKTHLEMADFLDRK